MDNNRFPKIAWTYRKMKPWQTEETTEQAKRIHREDDDCDDGNVDYKVRKMKITKTIKEAIRF